MTDKEKYEMQNLRDRVVAQRQEIKVLQDRLKVLRVRNEELHSENLALLRKVKELKDDCRPWGVQGAEAR